MAGEKHGEQEHQQATGASGRLTVGRLAAWKCSEQAPSAHQIDAPVRVGPLGARLRDREPLDLQDADPRAGAVGRATLPAAFCRRDEA